MQEREREETIERRAKREERIYEEMRKTRQLREETKKEKRGLEDIERKYKEKRRYERRDNEGLYEQFFERMSDLTRNHVEAELCFDLRTRMMTNIMQY